MNHPLTHNGIRIASTVLLLRDAPDGMEVFMVKRPGGMDFPDLHVFPGGKVDEPDQVVDACEGLDDLQASSELGLESGGLRYWVAAIRECFEEAGVLLARDESGFVRFDDPARAARFDRYRHALADGEETLAAVCAREGLTLACDAMSYFSHWITPETAPRRFDTRFFVAAMPARQQAVGHATETADGTWVNPTRALGFLDEGRWQMIHPTFVTLDSIRSYGDVSSALEEIKAGRHLHHPDATLREQGMHSPR